MTVARDGNINIFLIVVSLVEGETISGWSLFINNLLLHVAPQPNLCLVSNIHPSIESSYNNLDNGWQDHPSTHVYYIKHITQNFMREIKDKANR